MAVSNPARRGELGSRTEDFGTVRTHATLERIASLARINRDTGIRVRLAPSLPLVVGAIDGGRKILSILHKITAFETRFRILGRQ